MPYCPFCGAIVNDMDINCAVCKAKLPDNYLQINRNEQLSRNEEFLKIQQNYPQYNYQYPPHEYQSEYPEVEKKRSWASALYRIFCILISILLIFAIFQYGLFEFSPTKYTEVPKFAEFTVERITTIICISGSATYELKIPKPKSLKIDNNPNNEYIQHVVSVSPNGDYIENNYWYNWEEKISAGEKHNIKITYKIKAKTYKWDIDESNSGTIDDIPKVYADRYSSEKDEWLIETTNPIVVSLAEQLTKDKTNVYEKVRAIYLFLKENIKYEIHKEPQSCTTTLQTMTGDCDDQSILFSALCRAVGIPAWLEYGFIYDKKNKKWGGHGWATVCIPLKNGYVATPSVDVVNKKFLWEDCYRITEWVDDGNAENLKNYYDFFKSTSKGNTLIKITEPYFKTIELKTYGSIKIPA